ncbi:exosome complex component MTR3 [Fistulifera solaris]|uniref:Exosome complex component MTR3 n=1 Tax=Fistulifera solaris TaxID=1519565 RepID=A0A1Z5JBY0_FISSO|nr:exosome complex component MTR3 [Fistulifera solaris]|eukprot:GAX11475.1 exosome complex component MTR3 [Fistulifera solaris]
MTKSAFKLSNCYFPLELPSSQEGGTKERHSGDGKTTRASHSLRRIHIDSQVLQSGSALVEMGHTKVICQVTSPVYASSSLLPSSVQLSMDEGTLYCQVNYLSHASYPTARILNASATPLDQSHQQFSSSRINTWRLSRESDLSARLLSALQAAVPLQQYPKCCIRVQVTVLQDDGSVLPACIAAASIALTRACVELYDLVTSCQVALQNGILLADPDLDEEESADALVTLAFLPNWKEVSLLEQSGKLSPAQTNQAIDLCRDGCRTMHRFLRDHLLQKLSESKTKD